jgi:hypothetical protein
VTGTPIALIRGTGLGTQDARAVAIDSDGSYAVVGTFTNGIDVGSGFFTASPNASKDGWLARFEADGSVDWVRTFGGCGDEEIVGVQFAPDHSIVITGSSINTDGCNPIFDDAELELPYGRVGLVARYAADGAELAITTFGSIGTATWSLGLAVDGEGRPTVGGLYNSTIQFADGSSQPAPPGPGVQSFVVAFDAALTHPRWFKAIAASNRVNSGVHVMRLAALPGGDVAIIGDFHGAIDIGLVGELASAGSDDVLVAKLAADDGATIWAERYGGTLMDRGYALRPTPAGDLVGAGEFRGTTYFGDGAPAHMSNGNAADAFAARWTSAAGSYLESTVTSTPVNETAVAVGGDAWGGLVFGGGNATNAFLIKTAPGGAGWTLTLDATSQVRDLAVGADGSIIAVGEFSGTLQLGQLPALSSDAVDAFILRLTP